MSIMTQNNTTSRDQRSAARRQPAVGTVCKLDPGPGMGLVWNISEGGVSMLLNNPPTRGEAIRGVLTTAGDGFTLPVGLRVAHVAPLGTGDYVIGGQFDRPLAPDELRHFLNGR